MTFEYAVLLTGSIATGKSSVAKFFRKEGFVVIDADQIAHTILNQQHQAIAKMFGDAVVKEECVDRKALGAIVFSQSEKRKALEALLHPLIYEEICRQAEEQDKFQKPYLVDIPLFFESGKRYPIERVLVVYTTLQEQLKRLMLRDGSTKEEAQKRIDSQISIEKKREMAHYLIDNRGNLSQLEHACKKVKEQIVGEINDRN